jgi:hypothetical protein
MNACNIKALILDFDHTLFNTDADREVRFIGAIWDCEKEESLTELQHGITISSPLDIIDIL